MLQTQIEQRKRIFQQSFAKNLSFLMKQVILTISLADCLVIKLKNYVKTKKANPIR